MKQPKLSVTNQDLAGRFPQQLESGSVFIAAIGDSFVAKDNKSYTPMTICQRRTDLSTDTSVANKLFRGWDGYESILRSTQNVSDSMINNFQIGAVLQGYNLGLQVATTPFYTGQEPIVNPETNVVVTSSGAPLYRNVEFFEGEAVHTGLDIARDKAPVTSVAASATAG